MTLLPSFHVLIQIRVGVRQGVREVDSVSIMSKLICEAKCVVVSLSALHKLFPKPILAI